MANGSQVIESETLWVLVKIHIRLEEIMFEDHTRDLWITTLMFSLVS
jgi:hypothetical protein